MTKKEQKEIKERMMTALEIANDVFHKEIEERMMTALEIAANVFHKSRILGRPGNPYSNEMRVACTSNLAVKIFDELGKR